MLNSRYFVAVPGRVRYDKNLSFAAKILYIELLGNAKNNGSCEVSDVDLMEAYNMTAKKLFKCYRELVENEYIVIFIEYFNEKNELVRKMDIL